MKQLPGNTALIIIDVQQGFDDPSWGRRNNPDAEKNIAALLSAWREAQQPIFHICHHSTSSGSVLEKTHPGSQIKPLVAPRNGEPLLVKSVNSAFIGTSLERQLRDLNIVNVVITGLTTDHCVSTTTRMAANLGFRVYLVGDGTATFERTGPDGVHYSAQEMHDVNLASLNGEFATVVKTADVLAAVPQPAPALP